MRDWFGWRSLRHNARTPHERGHFEFQFSEKPCAVLPKHRAVVIDHAAVTPRYVFGFSATRELPIVARIAAGSLRNKLFVLLPATLAVSYFLPRMLTPLLMLGGIYLCYEGSEKVLEAIAPHKVRDHEARVGTVAMNAQTLEDEKVGSAVKTDFILSAEIMAITLAAVPNASFWMQALVLAIVGIGITIAVYGVVALIVKADDIGVALARHDGSSIAGVMSRKLGRALVLGMPGFLTFLAAVGTAAMIWVGGSIIVHGLEAYDVHSVGHAIGSVAQAAAHALPSVAAAVQWMVETFLSGVIGLLIGGISIPAIGFAIAPARKFSKRIWYKHGERN